MGGSALFTIRWAGLDPHEAHRGDSHRTRLAGMNPQHTHPLMERRPRGTSRRVRQAPIPLRPEAEKMLTRRHRSAIDLPLMSPSPALTV